MLNKNRKKTVKKIFSFKMRNEPTRTRPMNHESEQKKFLETFFQENDLKKKLAPETDYTYLLPI